MSPEAVPPAAGPGPVVTAAAPHTGDPVVDAVLGRMRAQLAEVSAEDLAGRRVVLDRAHRELRVLLDEPAPRSADDPGPGPGTSAPTTPPPGDGVGSVPE